MEPAAVTNRVNDKVYSSSRIIDQKLQTGTPVSEKAVIVSACVFRSWTGARAKVIAVPTAKKIPAAIWEIYSKSERVATICRVIHLHASFRVATVHTAIPLRTSVLTIIVGIASNFDIFTGVAAILPACGALGKALQPDYGRDEAGCKKRAGGCK